MLATVHINWDNGSTLSMCLDSGDRIHRITDAAAFGHQRQGTEEPGPAHWPS
jgi:hypothetical protein